MKTLPQMISMKCTYQLLHSIRNVKWHGDNAMLSCTAQTYFFLRHSLHNTGNGFIWFLVFLIKSKALKEKVFLLHFTFFFVLLFFTNYISLNWKWDLDRYWRMASSKKYFTERQSCDFFTSSTGGLKEKKKSEIQGKLIPQFKMNVHFKKINKL